MILLEELIFEMIKRKASDLHLVAGVPPQLRVDGQLVSYGKERLTPEVCQHLIYSVLTDEQKRRFEERGELDLSFGIKDMGRIRMNVFKQRGSVAAALRSISNIIPSFQELGLPPITEKVVNIPNGLILVTGPTGSGKSTTLASMIDYINTHKRCNIITLEDPIEYLYKHKNSIVSQREVGSDTHSFAQALKYIMRQDPDVILIGEMRDLETVSAALNVAETGHLVLATLHTPDAVQSINRIIDIFPPTQQQQVRTQLSFVIEAVFSQRLLPAIGGGRVLACEVMIATPAVRNLIRENKIHQIYTLIQAGRHEGMQSMNQALAQLYQDGKIEYEEAMRNSPNVKELKELLEKVRVVV